MGFLDSFVGGAAGGSVVAIYIRAYDEYTRELNNAAKTTDVTAKKMAASYAAATTASLAVAKGIYDISLAASKTEDVQKSFNRLVGVNGTQALEGLRAATRNTISDFVLLKNANLLLQNVQGITSEQMNTIAAAAVPLSKAVGITIPEAYERLSAGIAKGETELLDELGLKLDATVANRKYAESVGKSVADLTAQERATAALNNILPELNKRVIELGDSNVGLSESTSQLSASLKNLSDDAGNLFGPTLARSAEGWAMLFRGVSNVFAGLSEFRRQSAMLFESEAEAMERINAQIDDQRVLEYEQYLERIRNIEAAKLQAEADRETAAALERQNKLIKSQTEMRTSDIAKYYGFGSREREGKNITLNPRSSNSRGGTTVNINGPVQGLNPQAVASAMTSKLQNAISS